MHILKHKYDIVDLIGTWANDNVSDSELNIPGIAYTGKIGIINLKVEGEKSCPKFGFKTP